MKELFKSEAAGLTPIAYSTTLPVESEFAWGFLGWLEVSCIFSNVSLAFFRSAG